MNIHLSLFHTEHLNKNGFDVILEPLMLMWLVAIVLVASD